MITHGRRRPRARALGIAVVLATTLTACTGGSGQNDGDNSDADPGTGSSTGTGTGTGTGTTWQVPGDVATIQQAVDGAEPGDRIEIAAGVYEESVLIDVPDLTLVGADRNGVIVDGGGIRSNGIAVTADRVVVANLTVRDFNLNGVLVTGMADESGALARGSDGYTTLDPETFPPLQGFAVRGVTASNNGLYGIYAFNSQDGVIEQSYASGHADSGIYVGQCEQCEIVVRDNVAELNAVGYEQANASDSVLVTGNRLTRNRVGLTLLSEYQEAYLPQRAAQVVGNLVADNDAAQTPAQADGAFGIGIGLAGVRDNLVAANRVAGHPTAGIVLSSAVDLPPVGNRLEGNRLSDNAEDLWYAAGQRGPGRGNCVSGPIGRTVPADLAGRWTCPAGGPRAVGEALVMAKTPRGISFRDVVAPPAQPDLPADLLDAPPQAPEVESRARVPGADLLADRAHR